MVKRWTWLVLAAGVIAVAQPAEAQDFSRLDMAFGYGNWGVDTDSALTRLEDRRVSGFVMHTDINLTNWFTFENVTGAYGPAQDVTLVTNTFGVKLVARDVVDGRVSPYVAAGFGFGYFSSNRTGGGFSTSAARYAAGIDLNMSDAFAIRFDVGNLGVGDSLAGPDWHNAFHVATGVVFSLGY